MKKGESSLGTTGAETVDLLQGQVGVSGVAHPLSPSHKQRICRWPSWGQATSCMRIAKGGSARLMLGPFAWASSRWAVNGPPKEVPVRFVGMEKMDKKSRPLGIPDHVLQLVRVTEAVGVEVCLTRHLDADPRARHTLDGFQNALHLGVARMHGVNGADRRATVAYSKGARVVGDPGEGHGKHHGCKQLSRGHG